MSARSDFREFIEASIPKGTKEQFDELVQFVQSWNPALAKAISSDLAKRTMVVLSMMPTDPRYPPGAYGVLPDDGPVRSDFFAKLDAANSEDSV